MKMSRVTKGSGIFLTSNAVRAAQVSTDCKIIFCVCSSGCEEVDAADAVRICLAAQ